MPKNTDKSGTFFQITAYLYCLYHLFCLVFVTEKQACAMNIGPRLAIQQAKSRYCILPVMSRLGK